MSGEFASGDRYQLIDFGDGRKLESLAGYLIDRPSPAAQHLPRSRADSWQNADARYDADRRQWRFHSPWPESLEIDCGQFRMPVQPTPFGHIGLFPEQFDNWAWLIERGRELSGESALGTGDPAWALNLFGYTGASTMALVTAGLAVTHVDAAKPNVQACRRAAESNAKGDRPHLEGHLEGDRPIRFLVEDAGKFTAREVRRGRRYQVVVMDPPAYGHSPGGKTWRLQRDLWPLLDQSLELVGDHFALLVTGHSPEVDQADVAEFLRRHKKLQARGRGSGLNLESGRSQLTDTVGRSLDAGFFVRLWC